MVVKEDGTKWACQSCLKGHRVSGCTHTDRELILVPKKGRPVTQCHHCRLERKKRSAHVRCECGEVDKPHHPKEKCIHLREAEERAKAGFHDDLPNDAIHLAAVAEEQGCCCHHGGKCSCALLKKEPDPSRDISPFLGPAVQKPRLESTRSDGSITVFANGHHKPVHRKNHAAHECGMPYKMPMPRTQAQQNVSAVARRSVDSLVLDSKTSFGASPFPSQTGGLFSNGRRLSRSEQPSPKLTPLGGCEGLIDSKLTAIEFNDLGPVMTNTSVGSAPGEPLSYLSVDPMSAVADASYDPWSAIPSADSANMPNNNPFGAWASTTDGNMFAQPALTAASSGTQSEIDEVPPMDDFYSFMPSIQEDDGTLSPDVVMGGNTGINRRSLPPSFFGNTDFSVSMTDNDWQTSLGEDTKMKPITSDAAFGQNESWSTPNIPTMASMSARGTNGTNVGGRPQSHSIGPGSAPDEDIIKQLFPDDVEETSGENRGGVLGAPDSPATWKRYMPLPNANPSSGQVDLSGFDEENGFVSQPWSGGSVNVPNDTFTTSFDLDQEFTNTDFSNNWTR